MLMASLQFHWGIDQHALFSSPLLAVGWAASLLLFWNIVIIVMQERYDYFTRSQKSTRYRPRRRLLVWETSHALFSSGLFAVSFSINLKASINDQPLKGFTHLLDRAQCFDTRHPGCAVGITADTMLGLFASIQWGFVGFLTYYNVKGIQQNERRPMRYDRYNRYDTELSEGVHRRHRDEEKDLQYKSSKRRNRGQLLLLLLECEC